MSIIKLVVIGKSWRDKTYGNTYFAARVYDTEGKVVLTLPFQYGYGDQYIHEALVGLVTTGVLPPETLKHLLHSVFSLTIMSTALQKEVKAWGTTP